MGCGAGKLKRSVVAQSRHGNANNQVEEDSLRSRDEQQALELADDVDKVLSCDKSDAQQTNDDQMQVNKQDEPSVSKTQDDDVNKPLFQLEMSGKNIENNKQQTVNKQHRTSTEFTAQDGSVNKQAQQEISDHEVRSSEDSKQQHVTNKQSELCSTQVSDKYTSENSNDKQVEICEQPEQEWVSTSQSVNKRQLIVKQQQEMVTFSMEQPISLVVEHKLEGATLNNHTPPCIDEEVNKTTLSVDKHSYQSPTPEVLCTAIRVNQCSTHNNDHINQRQHTTTPPLHNDTLEARELPEVHNVDNTLWTAQDIMSYIIPPHSTPPPSGTAYTSPYQCGIARSLSQSPRIVGLQVQLGFVNVTCADLDVLENNWQPKGCEGVLADLGIFN